MKLKPLLIAVTLLAAGAGLAYWLSPYTNQTAERDPLAGTSLLDAETLNNTHRIELSGGNNGSRVALEINAEGEWHLPDHYGIPADMDKLSRFTRSLLETKRQRRVTANPERLERLGLDQGRIVLRDPDGTEIWNLQVGGRGETGGSFVRPAGEDAAYLTDTAIRIDSRLENWPVKRPLNFDASEVAALTLEFPGESAALSLGRNDPGETFSAGGGGALGSIRQDEVDRLLRRLLNARFNEVRDHADAEAVAARENAREITLRRFDDTEYTLLIGRKPAAATGESATETDAEPDRRRTEASIIFDHEGNIVTPPEPEKIEEETAISEPGPVFIVYRSDADSFPWRRITDEAALTFPDSVYNALPESMASLFEEAEAADDNRP